MNKIIGWGSMALLSVLLMAAFAVAARHHHDAGNLAVYEPWQGVLAEATWTPAPASPSPTLIPPVTAAPVAETATPVPPAPAPAVGARVDRLCAPATVAEATDSLRIIDNAQGIHAQWIEYIRNDLGGEAPPNVGDIAWHQQWVADYATVIDVLQTVLEVCQPGGLTTTN